MVRQEGTDETIRLKQGRVHSHTITSNITTSISKILITVTYYSNQYAFTATFEGFAIHQQSIEHVFIFQWFSFVKIKLLSVNQKVY